MPQIKITITDEEYNLLETQAKRNLNSISKEARVILHHNLYGAGVVVTPTPTPTPGIPETPYKITVTSNRLPDGHKKNPLLWLQENSIDPMDTTMSTYRMFNQFYPDVNIQEFDKLQQSRRSVYQPDPSDPYDPMINNPYLRNQ